jgi:sterol desaturase/sphingolipid hydroxylase (fatty acid hydroxylase superfamily)
MMNRETLLFLISTPLFLVVIGLEITLSHFHHWKLYTKKDTLTNICLMGANITIDLLTRTATFIVLQYFASHALFNMKHDVWYWTGLILGVDFMYYWLHRLDHSSRVFWAVHVTHHSSEEFNLTTGFRSSVFEPLYRFIFYIPLAFCGFQAIDIFFAHSLVQVYGILIHTKTVKKMGILEHILVTPSHHRVHHASNIKYLDRNLGMFLIVWDKLFGTFEAEDDQEPVRYGLTKQGQLKSNAVDIIFHEFNNIARDVKKPLPLITKLRYIFAPPGWSHDGSTKTTEELRKGMNG